ncbi:GNAT family N-acetyltransferase [Vibrio parahaemolyticus]|uniref:GNAT family N-acetyltransferase n=1 Tax=Vibrio parahaemolyticus TaxID=670 RepID=A0AA46L3L4_VIBPH|nr:GNAT family N-acetyltransferase [Vibrio parahaemolyticus]EID4334018.1 GNAT family N-acetyltransferase [Vibrio parahaemolyticus]MDG2674773.1 GNAT family N-acetyltransferase [Vibrio parahaemolyticus]TXN13579.1 GNAT family N-acetyltransferase [Vibrio parahaemolyticus]
MRIVDTLNQEQIAQVHRLYMQTWWAKERTLEQTISCINGSQLCVGILDNDDNVVGFARVLTDFIFKAIIFDVIVCEEQRNSGLGAQLMRTIQQHDRLKHIRHFELYCLPEMETYYEQFGFSSEVGGIVLMRQTNA